MSKRFICCGEVREQLTFSRCHRSRTCCQRQRSKNVGIAYPPKWCVLIILEVSNYGYISNFATALLIKSLLSALLWSLILYSFFVGELPDSLHLKFRQSQCIKDTAIVVFFTPVRPVDTDTTLSHGLIIAYVSQWFHFSRRQKPAEIVSSIMRRRFFGSSFLPLEHIGPSKLHRS